MPATDLVEKYKNIKTFSKHHGILINPENYRSEIDCINAFSPTFKTMQDAYGDATKLWIKDQIDMLQTLSGVSGKLLAHQLFMLVETFLTNKNVKASMFLNFCHKMIAGHYGRFYGSVDMMQIGEAWQSYINECNALYLAQENRRKDEIERIKEEERAKRDAEKQKQIEAERANAISWDEFVKIQKDMYNTEVPSLRNLAAQILKQI